MAISFGSYEEAVRTHQWNVPERYNIAEDVCFKHPADKLAMIHEDFEGNVREIRWGELQEWSNRFANVLRAHGVQKGDRVAMLLPPTPETAAAFFGTYKAGAILLSMSVLYGDDGIRHRISDSQPTVLLTNEANAGRVEAEQVLILNEDLLAGGDPAFDVEDTLADDPAQLYYSSGTTGLAKGILHAHRYLLAHNEFELSHDLREDEPFHSTGEWAWIAGIVPGILAPWRFGVPIVVFARRGGYDPSQTLYVLEKYGVRNMFTTPTALRAMAALGEVHDRYPSITLRIACSAGEPLNPEVIRWFRSQFGIDVFDYYGLTESYPLCANFPTMDVRLGSMGRPTPGWDVQLLDEDEQPVPQGETGEICLRARSNPHYPIGYWQRPEDSEETFGGDWFHTRDVARRDEDGYVWYEGRNDDVIISAGYRIGPFEVESALVEHPAAVEAAAVAKPDERRGAIVKAFVRCAPGYEPSDELARELQEHARSRIGAYAYPREIEFVDDLPKTLTGKIRRIELRQREARQG